MKTQAFYTVVTLAVAYLMPTQVSKYLDSKGEDPVSVTTDPVETTDLAPGYPVSTPPQMSAYASVAGAGQAGQSYLAWEVGAGRDSLYQAGGATGPVDGGAPSADGGFPAGGEAPAEKPADGGPAAAGEEEKKPMTDDTGFTGFPTPGDTQPAGGGAGGPAMPDGGNKPSGVVDSITGAAQDAAGAPAPAPAPPGPPAGMPGGAPSGLPTAGGPAGGAPTAAGIPITAGGGGTNPDGTPAGPTIMQDETGFWVQDAQLNDVFQYLAQAGDLQYFHNSDLNQPNYLVTGRLRDDVSPVEQMEELGLMYGVSIYQKGTTVYAMTASQMSRLPTKPYQYKLRYLRPDDIDQIRTLLQPVLSAGTGLVDYEPKTNTLIIIDNEQKIAELQEILAELDRPKDQIAIEARVLRVSSGSRNRLGVDWSAVLGQDGLTFEATSLLNSMFGLPDSDVVTELLTIDNGQFVTRNTSDQLINNSLNVANAGLTGGVLSSLVDTVTNGVVTGGPSGNITRTVNTGATPTAVDATSTAVAGRANNFSSLRTFDDLRTSGFDSSKEFTRQNSVVRQGSSLVMAPLALEATLRALNEGGLAQQESSPTVITEDNEQAVISIIDRYPIITATVTETTSGTNISEEVRYQIDENDPVDDPATTREIGVTLAVTPTILPDGTIRMRIRPRVAQITEFIGGLVQLGNANLYPRVAEATVETIARVPNGYSLLLGGFYEINEENNDNKVPVLGDVPGLGFFFKTTDRQKTTTSIVFVITPSLYDPSSGTETTEMTKTLHTRHVLAEDHKWPDPRNPGFNYEPNLGYTVGNMVRAYEETPPWNPLDPQNPVNLDPMVDEEAEAQIEPIPTAKAQRKRKGIFSRLFQRE